MMPELDEPFGRHRWDPLTDAEQPLASSTALAFSDGEDTPDPPSPEPSDATT